MVTRPKKWAHTHNINCMNITDENTGKAIAYSSESVISFRRQ